MKEFLSHLISESFLFDRNFKQIRTILKSYRNQLSSGYFPILN